MTSEGFEQLCEAIANLEYALLCHFVICCHALTCLSVHTYHHVSSRPPVSKLVLACFIPSLPGPKPGFPPSQCSVFRIYSLPNDRAVVPRLHGRRI